MGFARELVKRGHFVEIWTCSLEPSGFGHHYEEDGVHLWQTPRWGQLGRHDGGYAIIDNFIRLKHSLSGEWDLIHAFDHRPNVLLPWLSLKFQSRFRKRKTLFCADWCDWWTAGGITTGRRRFPLIDRIEQKIEEGSKRIAGGVTVISSILEKRALECGVQRERLCLLPSGVDIERFPLLDRIECRRRLDLPENRPILGFVGFSFWDLELLAEAFQKIQKQVPQAILLVIGGGVEENAKDIFRQRFMIGNEVILPGTIPFAEIPTYLGACDIQLLPMNPTVANRARLPNKLCDYMASGRPIVASDIGEGGEIVKTNGLGIAVGEGSEALANGCLTLLNDPFRAANYGKQGRSMAETRYAYSHLTDTLIQFYNRIHNRNYANIQ